MLLKRLKLLNFRNYSALDLEFDQKPTILLGDNGAGKSNILEAVYFLSTTKSVRVEVDAELIKEGEDVARVEAEVEETALEIFMSNNELGFSKRLKVNGIPRRAMDFIGNLPAVIFYPSDINMITGSPSLRRWHLDLSLAQVSADYKKNLTLFEQVLTSRNKVLKRIKEGEGQLSELTFWTDELLKYSLVIVNLRLDFFAFINSLESPLGGFKFEYKQSLLSRERLEQYSSREIAAANTLIGPHRDDFICLFKGKNLSKFGSRGEQRTGTLAFKLAQLEFMALKFGARPILLLDDVFSELDASHREYVTKIANLQQTIISTVELENVSKKFLNSARILQVDNGKISSKE